MRYTVLTESSTWKLAVKVEEFLAFGWKLAGGVSVARDQGGETYAQALTKE